MVFQEASRIHGFKWLRIANLHENSVLKFGTEETLMNVIKAYLGRLIDNLTPDMP